MSGRREDMNAFDKLLLILLILGCIVLWVVVLNATMHYNEKKLRELNGVDSTDVIFIR